MCQALCWAPDRHDQSTPTSTVGRVTGPELHIWKERRETSHSYSAPRKLRKASKTKNHRLAHQGKKGSWVSSPEKGYDLVGT